MSSVITAILGLGSNLGDRADAIHEAVRRLSENPRIEVINQSSLYETKPEDYRGQPDFLNAAVEVETDLKPEELLALVLDVEEAMGRQRVTDKGPRVIDVDILLYDIVEVRLPELTVPHERLNRRAFALVPLLEIAPQAQLPDGTPVRKLLKGLDMSGVRLLRRSSSSQ